ncbi:MAG TPA: STAS domain-containing protein [Micromonosporaceae bacterium]
MTINPRSHHGAIIDPMPDQPDSRRLRIFLYGEIDMATAHRAQSVIDDALGGYPDRLDIDLGDVSFLDSSGITMLMGCWRRADGLGCRLSVVNARPNVYRVLQITGVLGVLDVATPV